MTTIPAGLALIIGARNLSYNGKRIVWIGFTLPPGYVRLVFADGTTAAVWRDVLLQVG